MKVHSNQISVKTSKRSEVVPITDRVADWVTNSQISSGFATVTSLHTTCALTLNEAEPRLLEDIRQFISRLAPEDAGYRHDEIDDNAHAHLRSVLLSSTLVIPIKDGQMVLGTWQNILLVESDGPRERKVLVQTVGI